MPPARNAARRRRSSVSKHRRRKKRPKWLPAVLFAAGAGVAAGVITTVLPGDAGMELEPMARPVPTVPFEVDALRESAADDVARSRSTSAPTPTPTPTPTPSPKSTPLPTADQTTPTAPTSTGFPAVGGCAATIPGDGTANGELSEDELCDIGSGHRLRPDAATAFLALDAAYRAETGERLVDCVTDSYRSYDAQVDLRARKPGLAAQPGTSNHGWGVAVDIGCGANSYDDPTYSWLASNGTAFGWHNPPWAQPDGSKPEPWHWEYSSSP